MRLNAISSVLELNEEFISKFPSAYHADSRFQDTTFTKPFSFSDGFWYDHLNRIVVPSSMQAAVMKAHHATAFSGHFGPARTMEHISRQFWWPYMQSSVKFYCDSCPQCQQNKSSNKRPFGLLQPHSIPSRPWSHISTDLVTDLPASVSHDGHTYDAIVTFVCIPPQSQSQSYWY
jgi:hypothetical protein